jgi:TonB family protein
MKFSGPLTFLTLLFVGCILSAAQAQNETQAAKKENGDNQTASLKAINTPMAPYPEEAVKKGIEGKVTLRIVVDAKGTVSQAEALNGPKELIPAALASVKMWQYERPVKAPATKTVELGYGFPKECPGPISDMGEVQGNGRLFSKEGKLVAVVAESDYPLPPYPESERRAGVAGTMILSITLSVDGSVKEIYAAKSLSPSLDRAAIDTVRPLRFKEVPDNPDASLEDLRLRFIFRASCNPLF